MSILIFGAGFLGTRLARELPDAILSKADIADPRAVESAIAQHRPAAVLNAAGKTGTPNVDWCEAHPLETARSNVLGAITLAEVCVTKDIYLLHLASGCIFYGPSPAPEGWREDDYANPSAVYSRSKYAADLMLSRFPNVGIARLRMPIDSIPGPRNLITKLAAYREVIDVENSVTVVDDLVKVIAELIRLRATGVFHATNPGTMRHRDLLTLYKELVDPSHVTTFIREEELVSRGLAVRSRSNCVLSSTRLDAIGLTMRPIDVALHSTMTKYAQIRRES
jgi:dTDP-4-dehydrorhamnose reductase